MMTPWATADDVLSLTNAAVTHRDIGVAQGVISTFTGIDDDDMMAMITGRDARYLQRAVCYQAAWMVAQIDALSRTDVATLDQDGVNFQTSHRDALVLAPMAKRCIDRLSWMRTRTRMQSTKPLSARSFVSGNDDDDDDWSTL